MRLDRNVEPISAMRLRMLYKLTFLFTSVLLLSLIRSTAKTLLALFA